MTRPGWLLIDHDGQLHRCPGPARTAVPEHFGHPLKVGYGLTRVGLDAAFEAVGWILMEPDSAQRNPVGACILVALGGPRQVVAGPVAVTGWNGDTAFAESTPDRTLDLGRAQVRDIEVLHQEIVSVLSGQEVDRPADWIAGMRAVAAHVGKAEPLPRDSGRDRIALAAMEKADRFLAGDLF